MTCLLTFPPTANLDDKCPRCGGEAGDHPAPASLLANIDAPVQGRPTLREVKTSPNN